MPTAEAAQSGTVLDDPVSECILHYTCKQLCHNTAFISTTSLCQFSTDDMEKLFYEWTTEVELLPDESSDDDDDK